MINLLQSLGLDANFFLERIFPTLNRGLWVSCMLIAPSAILGFFGGVGLGALRVYGSPRLRRLGNGYTALFRGVPLIVQLFFIYNCLPKIGIGLDSLVSLITSILPADLRYSQEIFRQFFLFEPFGAAVIGFTLCSAAYHSEYIRGALLSIRQGQVRAAQALGFSTWRLTWSIVIPQAMRRALPGCGNEIIYLIKYSSLASAISCLELTGEAQIVAGRSYRYTEVFLTLGCYYLVLTSIATAFLHWLEKHFAIPGFGKAKA